MVRVRDKSLRPICRIDWSVFRAVSLVLLIAFLGLSGPIIDGTAIHLPAAKHTTNLPGAAREDALLIAITRDGKIFFGAEGVDPASLPERLHSQIARGTAKHVYISADTQARYGAVAAVIDASRAAGIEQVSFITFMPRMIKDSRR